MILLWIFADAYLMPKLQNAAMNAIFEEDLNAIVGELEPDTMEMMYARTAKGSALRRVFLDEFVGNRMTYGDQNNDYLDGFGAIPGFFREFIVRMEEVYKGEIKLPSEENNYLDYFVAE